MTPAVSLAGRVVGWPVWKHAKLKYLRLMSDVIDAAKSERDWLSLQARVQEINRRYPPTALVDASTYSHAFTSRTRAEAQIALMQTALAVHLYKLRNNRLPQSLAQAQIALGRPLPNDPFSGALLRYRRDGARCILYSIGPNVRDDGGKEPEARTLATTEPAKEPDDITLVLEAPRRK